MLVLHSLIEDSMRNHYLTEVLDDAYWIREEALETDSNLSS